MKKRRTFSGESHADEKVCDVLMRMITGVGTEDTEREMYYYASKRLADTGI